jgi:hypothetical protein
MAPVRVAVRYRHDEGGEAREAWFHGLFFERSERAVLGRLREIHRRAARVEVLEARWRHPAPAGGLSAAGGATGGSPARPGQDRAR